MNEIKEKYNSEDKDTLIDTEYGDSGRCEIIKNILNAPLRENSIEFADYVYELIRGESNEKNLRTIKSNIENYISDEKLKEEIIDDIVNNLLEFRVSKNIRESNVNLSKYKNCSGFNF